MEEKYFITYKEKCFEISAKEWPAWAEKARKEEVKAYLVYQNQVISEA